ncbi:23S rRNA (adenine2030-N6)-methyltransferase [Fontimonas thermophila]|uniref:23S rRNA (Adenine2030-N6)-methyltransferase n=1 Tax=Fontimonas thermophila TaxID=1076937 RepID=A0A1I2KG89_9GAMM|nr:23S rRNA (adenine2030-N6)-methyltransferase [Fontimonas thermophila]
MLPISRDTTQYLDLVRAVNGDGPLRRYPGSPLLALQLARAQDRILVCEQVPATANLLRTALAGDARASVHLRDGYEAVALLPPRQRRGLVLVDPPFERADEFDAITDFTMTALRRFGHGVYALWYPYKNRWQTERWLRRMRAMVDVEALDLQLDTGAPSIGQMHACGLLVLNPPFAFAAAAPGLLDALCPLLAQGSGARVASTPWPRRMTRSAIR